MNMSRSGKGREHWPGPVAGICSVSGFALVPQHNTLILNPFCLAVDNTFKPKRLFLIWEDQFYTIFYVFCKKAGPGQFSLPRVVVLPLLSWSFWLRPPGFALLAAQQHVMRIERKGHGYTRSHALLSSLSFLGVEWGTNVPCITPMEMWYGFVHTPPIPLQRTLKEGPGGE